MRAVHRSILRITGRTVVGMTAGALCGFALLSLGFVVRNQYPSQGTAMVIVLLAALAGGGLTGARAWRTRAESVPADEVVTADVGPAVPAEPAERPSSRVREVVVARWTALRDRRAGAAVPAVDGQSADGQFDVHAVPDAA